ATPARQRDRSTHRSADVRALDVVSGYLRPAACVRLDRRLRPYGRWVAVHRRTPQLSASPVRFWRRQPQRHRRLPRQPDPAAAALRGNGSLRRSLRIPPVGRGNCGSFALYTPRMLKILFSALLSLTLSAPAFAQSQGANGAIEGIVSDQSAGVLPGVTVTVTNIGTNAERVVVTNDKGLYRAPLLPLGTYRVVAELQGFKRFEQSGITLSVGQTAVVNVTLGVGTVSETITVIANSPLLDSARIDIGHTLTDQEVHNLPLVARNPYNFALAQPGVTGIENVEFGVPRLAANGAAMRINYQIDGNTNTEKDRAGLRLLPMSEVMIQEVKVVTTGFAPEFGQTMGMVYNGVTPSGTNKFKGEGAYLFRRKPFSAFPFFFGCGSSTIAANCQTIDSVIAAGA